MTNTRRNEVLKVALILALSVGFTLFVQAVKLLKNPASTPITSETLVGIGILWLFSFLGYGISVGMKQTPWKIVQGFPMLGWVSLVSLFFCLLSNFFVEAIGAVDFLSLTTTVLAFAGVSVANDLGALRKLSWKIFVVALFVFVGMYLGDTIVSQLALLLASK